MSHRTHRPAGHMMAAAARHAACRPRVEAVTDGDFTAWQWESWCRAHPLPNGDTGVVFDRWADALEHAVAHAVYHQGGWPCP